MANKLQGADWKRPLERISHHFHDRVSEWLIAGILTSWGTLCLNAPAVIWDLPVYSMLARIFDQQVWGMIALALGATRIAALFINGAYRHTPHARAICAFFSCLIWCQITLGLMISPVQPIAVGVYPWLFAADIYNVFRASRDARRSDRFRARRGAEGNAAAT